MGYDAGKNSAKKHPKSKDFFKGYQVAAFEVDDAAACEAEPWKQRLHHAIVGMSIHPKTAHATARQSLYSLHKASAKALPQHLLGYAHPMYYHIIFLLGEPRSLNRAVGRFPIKKHRTIGQHLIRLFNDIPNALFHVGLNACAVRVAMLPLVHPRLTQTTDSILQNHKNRGQITRSGLSKIHLCRNCKTMLIAARLLDTVLLLPARIVPLKHTLKILRVPTIAHATMYRNLVE